MTASDVQLVVESVNGLVESVNSLRTDVRSLGTDVRRVNRLVQSYILRPAAGRPRHPEITRATKMRREGKSWRQIYRSCLPDRAVYASADTYREAQGNLRKAVTQRLKRDINSPSPERASSR